MYVGHYAAAALLVTVVPDAPVLPAAVGVAWPDLLWPVLVLTGRERVRVGRDDPLQRAIDFEHYPLSHSLVLSNLIAIAPALLMALVYRSWIVGAVFWVAAISHWLLDLVVHRPDLPVVGIGAVDRKVGGGLWMFPRSAFVVEYLFFAAVILVVAPPALYAGVLGGGAVLHVANANSAFAVSRGNPVGTPARFAVLTLAGYLAAIAWFLMAWR